MKIIDLFLLLILLSLPLAVNAQDTLKTSSKSIEVGKLNRSGNKVGWWKSYDSSGVLESQEFYTRASKRSIKSIDYEYFPNGVLNEWGKSKFASGKHGKWKVYNEKGLLIKIERYRYGYLHGLTKDRLSGKKTRYYFGYTHEKLHNSKGKRYVFYFTVGLSVFNEYSYETEKFACRVCQIAGCIVTSQIDKKKKAHNFFVNVKQVVRFGFKWKRNYFKSTAESNE